jgi:hypothetical protein
MLPKAVTPAHIGGLNRDTMRNCQPSQLVCRSHTRCQLAFNPQFEFMFHRDPLERTTIHIYYGCNRISQNFIKKYKELQIVDIHSRSEDYYSGYNTEEEYSKIDFINYSQITIPGHRRNEGRPCKGWKEYF